MKTLILDNGRLAHDQLAFFIVRGDKERMYKNTYPSRRRRIEKLVSGKVSNLCITGNSVILFYNF